MAPSLIYSLYFKRLKVVVLPDKHFSCCYPAVVVVQSDGLVEDLSYPDFQCWPEVLSNLPNLRRGVLQILADMAFVVQWHNSSFLFGVYVY